MSLPQSSASIRAYLGLLKPSSSSVKGRQTFDKYLLNLTSIAHDYVASGPPGPLVKSKKKIYPDHSYGVQLQFEPNWAFWNLLFLVWINDKLFFLFALYIVIEILMSRFYPTLADLPFYIALHISMHICGFSIFPGNIIYNISILHL